MQKTKKQIAHDRIQFFVYEVALGFILIFLLLLIPTYILPLFVERGSYLYGILSYSLRAIIVFIGVPLILILSNLLIRTQKRNTVFEEDISPAIGHLNLYKITKKNYKYQILYGILLLFLVFIPLDFFTYVLIPGMLKYQSEALNYNSTNAYLGAGTNYIIFLISVIIIQFSVAISEETITRGLVNKRGSEHFFRMSAVIISALYFGLGHFAYFLNPISRSYPFWYPFIWFLQAFIIGIILSLVVLRKNWLFPVILAHALNNIISAHAVWNFSQGNDFTDVALFLYSPLLIIGVLLFIWQFHRIKESISIGLKIFKEYFKFDEIREETSGDRRFRVFFDVIMAFLIFIMGIMIMI